MTYLWTSRYFSFHFGTITNKALWTYEYKSLYRHMFLFFWVNTSDKNLLRLYFVLWLNVHQFSAIIFANIIFFILFSFSGTLIAQMIELLSMLLIILTLFPSGYLIHLFLHTFWYTDFLFGCLNSDFNISFESISHNLLFSYWIF